MQRKHKLLVASILILIVAIYSTFSIVLLLGNERYLILLVPIDNKYYLHVSAKLPV